MAAVSTASKPGLTVHLEPVHEQVLHPYAVAAGTCRERWTLSGCPETELGPDAVCLELVPTP